MKRREVGRYWRWRGVGLREGCSEGERANERERLRFSLKSADGASFV